MKRTHLVWFSDLLEFAQTLGYDWNEACEFLGELLPKDGRGCRTIYLESFDPEQYEGMTENSLKVGKAFMEKHNLSEFELTMD